MRDYSQVSGKIWIGETGKKIRKYGADAQLVAFYLMTAPSSNMIGLYYLPLPVLVHEIGNISFEGASKALRSLSEAHFAHYNNESETVWVCEMAHYQIGDHLEPNDKRIKGVERELKSYSKSVFYNDFLKKYKEVFHLNLPSPFEAPPKPLRSQEQEQEQEQDKEQEKEQEQEQEGLPPLPIEKPVKKISKAKNQKPVLPDYIPPALWEHFLEARKKAKKPMTDYAQVLAFRELDDLKSQGYDPIALINRAIKAGWLSFYPRDGDKVGAPELDGKVSKVTMENIKSFNEWSPPQDA